MTIKTRNRIIILLTLMSLVLFLGSGLLLGFQLYSGTFKGPVSIPYTKFQNFILTKFTFPSVIISIFFFLIYVFVTLLYINVEFEKTQSTEIIYFSIYLIGCLTEGFRLSIPLFNLWETSSSLTFFYGRIIIFGRILAPLSLLFISICSSSGDRQNLEQNIMILFVTAAVLASIIPLNTGIVLPVCRIKWGYEKIIFVARTLIAITTAVSLIINEFLSNSSRKIPWEFIMLIVGYGILCSAYNYILMSAGIILLSAGTFIYLKKLHNRYLWN